MGHEVNPTDQELIDIRQRLTAIELRLGKLEEEKVENGDDTE